MSTTRGRARAGRIGLALAGGTFHIALYICVLLLLFWIGQYAYHFGYDVFNQKAMSPGEGQEVSVVIQEGSSVLKIGKTLESKGLIENAYVFYVQELLSNYHGEMKAGTYLLSTAYTPTRIMGILAQDEEQEGAAAS
ncbi:MAG: solute-binding protein [Eubacteriales bacterium]|nr:solute-binding protein [Eubacteriales bacterium]